jgi:hypothetical protein
LKGRSGCGCLNVLVLLALTAGGFGVFAAIRGNDPTDAIDAVEDAIDDLDDQADDGPFGGDRVSGSPASPELPVEQELEEDQVGTHELEGIEGRAHITVSGTGDFDPVLRVIDADGEVLGEDDDGGDDRDARLTLTLPGGPGVQAEVREFSGDAGSYLLITARASAAGPELTAGTPVRGVVAADGAVNHPFTGSGRSITITVQGIDGFDPFLRVLSDDAVLGEDDDGGDGTDSRLELSIPEGEQVVVEVSGFGGRAGPYEVLVT